VSAPTYRNLKDTFGTILRRPTLLSVGISLIVFAIINVQGYWDIEDLFVAGYSVGSRYGMRGLGVDHTESLVFSLAGVPVLDFGIIGGYRLPFQSGTFSTGPFWIFRNLVSTEIILAVTHLASMLTAALAFGLFWKQVQSTSKRPAWQSSGLLALSWIALHYPTFEHMLPQDWYTVSISHQGFVAVSAALLTITLNCRSESRSPRVVRASIRLLLLGVYFLSVAHAGHFATYFPTIVFLSILTASLSFRHQTLRLSSLRLKSWLPEVMFSFALMIRGMNLLSDLWIETRSRSEVGSDYWWANPTQSFSNLKHFLGQLVSTEFQPWLLRMLPSVPDQFNVGPSSRLPHSAFLVAVVLLFFAVRMRNHLNGRVLLGVLTLWLLNFLFMIGIVRNPVRVSVDYHYRDILLTISMLAVGVVWHMQPLKLSSFEKRCLGWGLPVVLAVTSFSVSVNAPVFHHQVSPERSNPYALVNAVGMTDQWIETLSNSTGSRGGVLAVVDPIFLNRWKDKGNWQGLRGFYELREAGYVTLEGSPKIRDASAFTGLKSSLKQSLNAPSSSLCDSGLFDFLRVTSVITSAESQTPCYSKLADVTDEPLKPSRITPIALPDTQNKMWILNLRNQHTVFEAGFAQHSYGEVQCGLLTEIRCFNQLDLQPSSQWLFSTIDCRLPCVLTLSRHPVQQRDDRVVVLPLNAGNSLRVIETSTDTPRLVETTRFNGLLAIPDDPRNQHLQVVAVGDWRMWLHVVTAYSQYLVIIPPLVLRSRRWLSRHQSRVSPNAS
jgi:hypothetical protein